MADLRDLHLSGGLGVQAGRGCWPNSKYGTGRCIAPTVERPSVISSGAPELLRTPHNRARVLKNCRSRHDQMAAVASLWIGVPRLGDSFVGHVMLRLRETYLEDIRQIEAKALGQLRSPEHARRLRALLAAR
jgi:hypothetical protein